MSDADKINTVRIKQEPEPINDDESITSALQHANESSQDNNDGQPMTKRPKIEVADAESNTLHTGMFKICRMQ